uniref:FP protein C-terminal domain-containing protein n=1 Tax=Heliothis virescens TaxID=7102 RepID=A0A2A4IYM6_HELVI
MMLSPKDSKCLSVPDLHSSDDVDPNVNSNVKQRNSKRKQPDCELTLAISALSVELKKSLKDLRVDMRDQFTNTNTNISDLRDEFNNLSTTSTQIQNDLKELRSQFSDTKKDIATLYTKHEELSIVVSELKSSVNFNSANITDNVKRVTEMESRINTCASETISLLECKIDRLEQHARQCNIEIGNLPEKRGENLVSILESIASIISIPLTQRDIVAIHRVPHAHTQNSRPKNIIVKFNSRLLRDNMLSAYRLSKGITSDRLGLAGTQCRIYMNEHLTLRNKELFRKTREAAKTHVFKYVWVRNATVLVKETDDSPTYAIRSEDDISKNVKSKISDKSIGNN